MCLSLFRALYRVSYCYQKDFWYDKCAYTVKIFISWWSVIFRISSLPSPFQAVIADYTHGHNVAVKVFHAIAPSFTKRTQLLL